MGNFKQHNIIGFIVLGILYFILKYFHKLPILTSQQIILVLVITYFYSNMADIDLPNSKIHGWITIALILAIIYFFINKENTIGMVLAGLLIFFHIVHHRKLVHSVFMGAVLSAPLLLISNIYFIVALIAYIGHIASEGELSLFEEGDIRWINIFRR